MVRVILFAGLRDLAGVSIIEIPWSKSLTVNELRRNLLERYPKLERLLNQSRVVVADEFTEDSALVQQDAEVAFLPPVSGG